MKELVMARKKMGEKTKVKGKGGKVKGMPTAPRITALRAKMAEHARTELAGRGGAIAPIPPLLLGQLRMERVALARMNPAPYNPRVKLAPGDPEYKRLKESILAFGYVDPIIWNKRTGTLVAGHQRYTVLFNEGVKEADVSVVELDLPREKLLNLAHNKAHGRWDNDQLSLLLQELDADPSLDMALSGFDAAEIDRIVRQGDELVEMLLEKKGEAKEDGKKGKAIPEVFQVLVECGGERQQRNIYEELTGRGLVCKVLTL